MLVLVCLPQETPIDGSTLGRLPLRTKDPSEMWKIAGEGMCRSEETLANPRAPLLPCFLEASCFFPPSFKRTRFRNFLKTEGTSQVRSAQQLARVLNPFSIAEGPQTPSHPLPLSYKLENPLIFSLSLKIFPCALL